MPKKEKQPKESKKEAKGKQTVKEVELVIPMLPNLELAAAETASAVAELMEFDEEKIDEMKMALIEACINSFEHSKSRDKKVYIKIWMKEDELWLEITDHGIGFNPDEIEIPNLDKKLAGDPKKRGWGLEIMRGLMDKVEVHTGEEGTTIVMMKRKNSQ